MTIRSVLVRLNRDILNLCCVKVVHTFELELKMFVSQFQRMIIVFKYFTPGKNRLVQWSTSQQKGVIAGLTAI